MDDRQALLQGTRRHFFSQCGLGLGTMALGSLLGEGRSAYALDSAAEVADPLALRPGHLPARAKSVIYLFMAGGPSQFELFEHKPALQEYSNQPIPESFVKGRRFAFMDTFTKQRPKLLGTARKFKRHGESGEWVSECLPHLAGVVDDLTLIRTVATDVFNHAPAKLFANTGTTQFGRPSMGSWVTYGIGSESARPPRIRRAPVGSARPARRGGQLGERILADGPPGGAVALGRGADP